MICSAIYKTKIFPREDSRFDHQIHLFVDKYCIWSLEIQYNYRYYILKFGILIFLFFLKLFKYIHLYEKSRSTTWTEIFFCMYRTLKTDMQYAGHVYNVVTIVNFGFPM